MIIDKQYGPQYDPTDGTIGNIQLVRRYTLFNNKGYFYARQGRFTFESKESAQSAADEFIKNYPEGSDKYCFVDGLVVKPVWCYPNHFDPVHVIEEE